MKSLLLAATICVALYLLSDIGLWSLEGWQKWVMFVAVIGGVLTMCGGIIWSVASIK